MTPMNERPLRAGVVGLGFGRGHIDAYRQDPDCEVTAICDTDELRLRKAAEMHGIAHTFTDAQAMFESGLIDVVSIATPNALHHPLTLAAFRAGLHVLCEKPLAMNAGLAREMVDAADAQNKKLAIHYGHRMTPTILLYRKYVESGEVGDIYFARTYWHRRLGIPGSPAFISKETAGGGAFIDLGVHMLDQVMFIMGYPAVKSVSSQTYTRFDTIDRPGMNMDVEDFAVAFIRFENGATMEIEISWASHHNHPECAGTYIYGTKAGLVRVTENYKEVECSINRREHGSLISGQVVRIPGKPVNVHCDLLDAIRNDRDPLCSGRHGLITMQVIDAIYQSSRDGREVVIE